MFEEKTNAPSNLKDDLYLGIFFFSSINAYN